MRSLPVVLVLLSCIGAANAKDAAVRSYALPNHGTLELKTPAGWQDRVERTDDQPPTITFTPASGASFQVLVTPLWPSRGKPSPSGDEVKAIVQRGADGAAQQAVEKSIVVKELKGAMSNGYYFSATDRAPKPGEYKYLTQGMTAVGDLRVGFTILTNDAQAAVVKDALAMLAGAAQH